MPDKAKKAPKTVKTGSSLSEALELGQGVERPFRCEEHDDHDASASVNVLKGVWFCYACGAKGVTEGKRVPKVEDLRAMVEPEATCRIYPDAYLELFANGQGNFGERFDASTLWALKLGCDPLTGDATFPVRTAQGRLAGVGRRRAVVEDGPRYVYPPRWAASRSLFLASHHDGSQILVLTEGAGDASGVFEAGFNAGAVYGSGLHLPQMELIARIKPKLVVVALDADEAGLKGAHRARPMVEKRTPVLVHYWDRSNVKDPMELGPEGRREALSKTVRDGGYEHLMASPARLASDLRELYAEQMESA